MNATIFNRKAPAKDGWYQIEVSGEHPAGPGRRQLIDAAAREAIVNRFNAEREEAGENWAGLLVDADHLSHDLSQRTEAMGWLQELEDRDGELWGRIDVSDLGEAAVKNRRYKFFTTEYAPEDLEDLGDGRVRPLRLAGLAFTNRPNNRGGKPISNRESGTPPEADGTKTKTQNMKAIAEKLGLSAEATEADILTKLDDLMKQVAGAEAEAVMNRYSDRIPADKRDEVKEELIKNRAGGLEKILAFPVPEKTPAERIHNRAGANTPAPVEKTEGGDDATAEANREAERRELVEGIRNREGCKYDRAWNLARQRKPELFN